MAVVDGEAGTPVDPPANGGHANHGSLAPSRRTVAGRSLYPQEQGCTLCILRNKVAMRVELGSPHARLHTQAESLELASCAAVRQLDCQDLTVARSYHRAEKGRSLCRLTHARWEERQEERKGKTDEVLSHISYQLSQDGRH